MVRSARTAVFNCGLGPNEPAGQVAIQVMSWARGKGKAIMEPRVSGAACWGGGLHCMGGSCVESLDNQSRAVVINALAAVLIDWRGFFQAWVGRNRLLARAHSSQNGNLMRAAVCGLVAGLAWPGLGDAGWASG